MDDPFGAAGTLREAYRRVDWSTTSVGAPAGATVVFYTDGLIERRGRSVDEGFAELTGRLGGSGALTAAEICDRLLDHFGAATENDVVLTVLRAGSHHG